MGCPYAVTPLDCLQCKLEVCILDKQRRCIGPKQRGWRQAVKLYLQDGEVDDISTQFGISRRTLFRWARAYKEEEDASINSTA